MARTYTLLCSEVLAKARYVLQDSTAPYRNTDPEMLGWINDTIKTILSLVPGLFTDVVQHVCEAGFEQKLTNERASGFFSVVGVPEGDLDTLTLFSPGWQNAAQGPIVNWLRAANDPLGFYCTPPATAGQTLQVNAVITPTPLTLLTDLIPVPEAYEPAIIDYIVAMAQLKDDEAVDAARQQLLMANFASRIKGA